MLIIKQLKRHEGFKSKPYLCTAGKTTIGYGYNLDANPLGIDAKTIVSYKAHGITQKSAEDLLTREVKRLEHELSGKLDWWSKLNSTRQAVLLNMAYNLGINGLLNFSQTLSMISRGDYKTAAGEMLNSLWAGQVKGRAAELSAMMSTGLYLADSAGLS